MADSRKWYEPVMKVQMWAFPAFFSVLLIGLAQFNFLAFHIVAELFPIIVAFIMFALAWTTYDLAKNHFLLYLACGYLWVGSLDLLHMFAYKGINLFAFDGGNTGAQFWLAARYSESLLLLTAPVLAAKLINKYILVSFFGIITLCLATIILTGHFPVSFIEGTGLTPFKINSEYIIDGIFFMALFTLFRWGQVLTQTEKTFIAMSIVLSMCAELAFTFYIDVYGISNIVGHVFKLFSYWFIFRAIIFSNLHAPYTALLDSQTALNKTLKDLENQKYVLDHHALVVVTDWSGKITYVNDKFCDISGYSRQELLGINPRLLKSGEHSQDFYRNMWETISSGEIWHGEICNNAKDGSNYWLETTIAPLTDEKGNINQYIAIRTDVSDRKRTEEQLRQIHKMKAVGQLTGGIAHDFNNILAIIMGNLEILQMMSKDDPKALKRIETAIKGTKRGASLTDKLLGFSRTTSLESELIWVNDSINHMEELIEKSLPQSVTINNSLATDLWPVNINKGDFGDALLNLALNARDAMPDGGILSIKTTNEHFDDDFQAHDPSRKSGDYVSISVSDTGIGMTEKTKEKALEPFFTTKEVSSGTGLGLSMVHGFVQRSEGDLIIETQLGHGSTIKLLLPRAILIEGLADTTRVAGNDSTLPHGRETILVVDDEKTLIELAKINLSKLGYRVFTASTASEALKVLQSNQAIDLLFSDIVMPGGMDGYELAHQALNSTPSLKVLLTSGFAKKSERYLKEGDKRISKLAQDLLAKPYNQTDLAHAVRKTLAN